MSSEQGDILYVTRPHLPPLEKLAPLLEEIWRSRTLSNAGPVHERFEQALGEHLGVEYVSLVANATLGLTLALKQLRLEGEVITTPFTFVGTAHAITAAGLEPVFVDIDPLTFSLDPRRVREAIGPRTCAIMPVHCFGYECDVRGLDDVAREYGLPIIYDAAHAFGIDDADGSILRHGHSAVLSFHATKVFTTFEGGAVISSSESAKRAIDSLRNFGFAGDTVEHRGTNAKMNEFSAAIGLLQLQEVGRVIEERGKRDARYRELLRDVPGIVPTVWPQHQTRNYYNFPILVQNDFPLSTAELQRHMVRQGIVPRRYFHPLVTDFPVYQGARGAEGELRVARDIASRALCLPLFADLLAEDQERVVAAIRSASR